MSGVRIGTTDVGPGQPVFIIVEAGVNHNGDMTVAFRLIDEAVNARADAIKFQSYFTEEIVTPGALQAGYQRRTAATPDGTQYQMLKKLELSPEQQREIARYCRSKNIMFLSTPYDIGSVDLLHELDLVALKIASTDTTNLPCLRYVATKGRPVILSTGMCDMTEVAHAVEALETSLSRNKIGLLHCTSEYPAPADEANLRVIRTMEQAFGLPVGFSDHTTGIEVSLWAVAAGACMIEKHFTLDCSMTGPDHAASIEPEELADLVQSIRSIERSLGNGKKTVAPSEKENKRILQKSLVAAVDIPAGTVILKKMLKIKRPGTGLAPSQLYKVDGKTAAVDISVDEVLTSDSVQWTIANEDA